MVASRSSSFLLISAVVVEEKHNGVTPLLIEIFFRAIKILLTAVRLGAVPLGAAFIELSLQLFGLGFSLVHLVLVETAHFL